MTEFGGSFSHNGFKMSNYLAGGPYVPAGTRRNASAPTDGLPSTMLIPSVTRDGISFSHFHGASKWSAANVSVPNYELVGGRHDQNMYRTMYVTVSGGSGHNTNGYTYKWTKISGSSYVNISGSSTGTSVSIRCDTPGYAGTADAVFRCTVTDEGGTMYDQGTATFSWTQASAGGGGGGDIGDL
jgi:hypothetical protein